MECKNCGTSLPDAATYCGCGWKKLKPKFEGYGADRDVPCAHASCGIAAMCRVQTRTGWANLCWQHYDSRFRAEALENLDKYGMERQGDEYTAEWVGRMRQFVKSGFKAFGIASKSSNSGA